MEGKTAPTANGYVISISLAGRISRGSREKVFYRQKKLDRLSVVPRGGEISQTYPALVKQRLVSTAYRCLSRQFIFSLLSVNNNTGEFTCVERNPQKIFQSRPFFLSSTWFLARRHPLVATSKPLPTRDSSLLLFYHKRSVAMRSVATGSAQAPSAIRPIGTGRNSVEVKLGRS